MTKFRGRGKKFSPGRFRYSRLKEAAFGPRPLCVLNTTQPDGRGGKAHVDAVGVAKWMKQGGNSQEFVWVSVAESAHGTRWATASEGVKDSS